MPFESHHVCIRCAAQGTSCCLSREGIDGPPVTSADIERISKASGLLASEFVADREIDSIEQEAWEEEDPSSKGMVRNQRVRSIARRNDACFFLGEHGCTLGEARPLLCHRFPFVTLHKRSEVKPGGYCLAVEEAANLPALLVLLGTSKKRLREIDRQLAKELA